MRDIQEPPVKVWLIWSNEHGAWWKPSWCGYTDDLWGAGRYTETEAAEVCRKAAYGWRDGSLPPEVMVPAPENDQDKFSVDDLRFMRERMAARVHEATNEAIAERKAAEQDGEVPA